MSNDQNPNVNPLEPSPQLGHVVTYSFIALLIGLALDLIFRIIRRYFIRYQSDDGRIALLVVAQLIVATLIAVYLFHFFSQRSTRSETILFATLFFLPQTMFQQQFNHLFNKIEPQIVGLFNSHQVPLERSESIDYTSDPLDD